MTFLGWRSFNDQNLHDGNEDENEDNCTLKTSQEWRTSQSCVAPRQLCSHLLARTRSGLYLYVRHFKYLYLLLQLLLCFNPEYLCRQPDMAEPNIFERWRTLCQRCWQCWWYGRSAACGRRQQRSWWRGWSILSFPIRNHEYTELFVFAALHTLRDN